jgi:hypothetical protein
MAMMLGTGDPFKGWGRSGIKSSVKELPKKTEKFDFEQYVIRSPMRESGPPNTKGRQSPTMTYMSKTQINVPTTTSNSAGFTTSSIHHPRNGASEIR